MKSGAVSTMKNDEAIGAATGVGGNEGSPETYKE
jgi:hypothetical protein